MVKLGDVTAMRVRFEPGWKWSKCVKPVVGTESCQVGHLMLVVSGRMGVRMDDGSQAEFGPGDVGVIPPGPEPAHSIGFRYSEGRRAGPVILFVRPNVHDLESEGRMS